jgi:hypothetical protein
MIVAWSRNETRNKALYLTTRNFRDILPTWQRSLAIPIRCARLRRSSPNTSLASLFCANSPRTNAAPIVPLRESSMLLPLCIGSALTITTECFPYGIACFRLSVSSREHARMVLSLRVRNSTCTKPLPQSWTTRYEKPGRQTDCSRAHRLCAVRFSQ